MFSEKIRVAIADDSPIVIRSTADFLKNQDDIRITGTYENANATKHGLNGNYTDVLLLANDLSGQSVIDLLKDLKYHHPTLKVILVCSLENVAEINQGLECGAMGYLPKTMTESELFEAIRTVAGGSEYQHQIIKDQLIHLAESQSDLDKIIPELTPTEFQILQLIADEYTIREVSLELNLNSNTVEGHLARFYELMNVNNIAGLVRAAMGKGLI